MALPKQRVSFAEKNKPEWIKQTIDYIRGRAEPAVADINKYYKMYSLVNGDLDELDYTSVLNPFDIKGLGAKGYPHKMRNMDIISPNYQLLLAEKRQRPIVRHAIPVKTSGESKKQKQEFDMFFSALKQIHVNTLVESGIAPEELQNQPPSLDMIRKAASSIPDEFALVGQDALEYIDFYNEVPRNFLKGWADVLAQGLVFSYKDVINEDTFHEIVPPNEIYYIKDSNLDFLEDAEAVVRKKLISINDAIEQLEDEPGFTKDLLLSLEARLEGRENATSGDGFGSGFLGMANNLLLKKTIGTNPDRHFNPDNLNIEHVVFKSWTCVYDVTTVDALGNTVVDTYDESYIPDESEDYKKKWVREFYECYVLDNKDYIGFKAIPITRAKINNPNVCKNLYNGRVFSSRHNDPISWAERGLVFQIKYNTVYWHLDKVIRKNKDKLMVMPLELIPDAPGYDETTTMHYADTTSWIFVDTEGDARKMQALQYLKSIDMGLGNYVQQLTDLLQIIKQQWDELCGINPQRKGSIAQTAGKGTTQEAVFRSSMMSENLFAEYDEFQKREYQGLMDISKYAWINGKKSTFRSSDSRIITLDIDPDKYANCEYGVFIDDSAEVIKQRELLNQIAFAQAQKTERSAPAIKIIREKNMEALIQYLEELDTKLDEQQAAQQQMQKDIADQQLAQQQQIHDEVMDLEFYKIDENNRTKLNVEVIKSEDSDIDMDTNNNGIIDSNEMEKNSIKREEILSRGRLERDKLSQQKKEHDDNVKLKEKEIEANKFIAVRNKN